MDKKILGLTGALILGVVGIFLLEHFERGKADSRLGRTIVDSVTVIGFNGITISRGGSQVSLNADASDVWRLNGTSGFPADAKKIGRLIDDLTRTTVQVLASTSMEPPSEFGLAEGAKLSLQKNGQDIFHIRFGKNREHGGQFIAFGSDPKVYLINESVPIDATESAWELKTLIDISPNKVKKISFVPSAALKKKKVVLEREKSEDPIKLERTIASGKESASIRSHESILTSIVFTERRKADDSEFKKAMMTPSMVTVDLFDGRRYDINIGSTTEAAKKYFMAVVATKGSNSGDGDVKDVDFLNSVMKEAAFEVPSYVASKFEKGLADMLEKKGA